MSVGDKPRKEIRVGWLSVNTPFSEWGGSGLR